MPLDKQLVASRFARHYKEYHSHAKVQQGIATRLAQALREAAPDLYPTRALEIGMGTGFLSRELANMFADACWYFNDLVPEASDWMPEQLSHAEFLAGDAEFLDFPKQLDLIASASVLQWFESLDGFLGRCFESLRPGGCVALSSFGPRHMQELRELTGLGLDYLSLDNMVVLLETKGFCVLHHCEWQEELRFATGRDLLLHLRQTGVNGTAAQTWTPRRLVEFHRRYAEQFADAYGQLPLCYHPSMIIAQRPENA